MEAILNKKKDYYTLDDYYATSEDERIELVHGRIYNQESRNRRHQAISSAFSYKITDYIKSHNIKCEVYPAPFDVQLWENDDTVVVPDISVICDHSKLTKQGCTGAPDMIVEVVSPGNSRHDYIDKLALYNAAGVREYWIVDPETESTTVYILKNAANDFEMRQFSFADSIPVGIFEGLSICICEIEGN